ncbi:7268_t:CDS:2 [Gigaspora margarita]|uniref:7268_t:CDS:1 n=1 Tax=Gigaspora margarita TaxID=4874 RepID=A0ABN7WCK8_GIGMA|nr:7268_t:CDS:2 [Gigaspora margarita]
MPVFTVHEINNNKVRDRAIGEFNRLKEAYSSLYKQNQRLIAENEHWKRAVEGFAAAVQKNIEDASQKIIERINEIDGDDNENNTRRIDYDEIKRRAKEAAA